MRALTTAIPAPPPVQLRPAAHAAPRHRAWWRDWGVLETFIVVQYLSTALFWLPGAQGIRIVIRTLPFLLSGALFLYVRGSWRTRRPPPGLTLLLLAQLVLLLNMLHDTTQPLAGLAQLALQVCIAAPLLWVGRAVKSEEHFGRLLGLVLACNAISAIVGLLQVYWPAIFLPPEFNQTAVALDQNLLTSLSYVGSEGQLIVRPPGLTDMPGGAAGGGTLCALFGIATAAQPGTRILKRLGFGLLAGIGFAVLYFTQVRSVLLMTVVALGFFSLLATRQRRPAAAAWTLGLGGLMVIGAFVYASAVGGEAVADRFMGITERGVGTSFQQERGHFLRYTLTEVLPTYPFGAGVGRWGVMNLYFGDPNIAKAKALYAEIQLTGWIYDGGIPLAVLYGGAILLAMLGVYRVASTRAIGEVGYSAAIVFCALLMITGMTLAGPSFNTQLGIQFWTLVALVHAAHARAVAARARARATAAAAAR